jgi:hypothetical protein
MLLEDLERRWILNLSIHFRDKLRREKFFMTYTETLTHWRRLTISLDHRNAPERVVEGRAAKDFISTGQSARMYEAICESLPDI